MKIDFKHECPVPILQDEWEFEQLLPFFTTLAPKNILEIGSFFGGTLWYWIKYAGNNLQKLVSIDFPIPKSDIRYNKMVESKNKWTSWIRNDLEFAGIDGDSRDEQIVEKVETVFQDNKIDYLFIDGCHDPEVVYLDYINYGHLVRKNGLIVFHDILSEDGVRSVWSRIKRGQRYIEIVNTLGIGILYANGL